LKDFLIYVRQKHAFMRNIVNQQYNEPDETEWGTISSIPAKEVSVDVHTVKSIFKHAQSGETEPWKQASGKGHHQKLEPENNGIHSCWGA
jgi:hypothetical protein